MKKSLFIFLFACFIKSGKVCAEVRLPAIVGNHMVLVQNSTVNIWGWANPYENITIKVEWDNSIKNVVADFRTGKWALKIKTPATGGPFEITVAGDNKIILQDVLIGEVWLC